MFKPYVIQNTLSPEFNLKEKIRCNDRINYRDWYENPEHFNLSENVENLLNF